MLLVRKARVTVVPVLSLAMTAALTAGLVHQLWVKGETIVRLLPGFVLPAVGFLVFAALTACRLERRDERIHWRRLWRRGAERVDLCAICAVRWTGRYEHLDVSLRVRGESVLEVIGLSDGPKAEAKARRIADALGLLLERESDATSSTEADARGDARRRKR